MQNKIREMNQIWCTSLIFYFPIFNLYEHLLIHILVVMKAVLPGRHSGILLKSTIEIRNIRKSHIITDLIDTEAGSGKETFGMFHTDIDQRFCWGDSICLFQTSYDISWMEVKVVSDILKGKGKCKIP